VLVSVDGVAPLPFTSIVVDVVVVPVIAYVETVKLESTPPAGTVVEVVAPLESADAEFVYGKPSEYCSELHDEPVETRFAFSIPPT
jgi:hypothetical protein